MVLGIKSSEALEAANKAGTRSQPSHLLRNATSRNTTSPILKLHHDILLEIFRINANMDQDPLREPDQHAFQEIARSINTTRNSSQVTSLWRDLIVNSPTVWAGLIDLCILEFAGEYWREEVLRRTQTSPMHVKGFVSLQSLNKPEPWWPRFLNDNWTRIRKFDINVKTFYEENSWFPHFIIMDYPEAARYRQALPFLAQPNSTLESFRIVFPHLGDPLEHGASLFGNCAPRLRFFQSQNMRFDTNNSWMSQLQSLHIHEYNGKNGISLVSLCQILSQVPLLECLTIEECMGLSQDVDKDLVVPIHFPRLQYLNVSGGGRADSDRSAYWNLLNNIIPPPDCSISARLVLPATTGMAIDLRVLSRLAENYFRTHASTYLEISVSQAQFTLTDCPNQWLEIEAPIAKMPFFDFTFNHYEAYSLGDITVYDIFEALFAVPFPHVLDLNLDIAIISRPTLFQVSNPQLGEMLSSFSSTENLTTTLETLEMLCISQPVLISTLFPQLKVLKMPIGIVDVGKSATLSKVLTAFLMLRKEAGVPISAFEYICSVDPYEGMMDLTFLESTPGLRVIWHNEFIGSGEYICGSGRPEELEFNRKSELAGEA